MEGKRERGGERDGGRERTRNEESHDTCNQFCLYCRHLVKLDVFQMFFQLVMLEHLLMVVFGHLIQLVWC